MPQTPAEQEPFAAWQDSARLLARDLEADMCDDRGHPLGLHAFAAIDTELKKLYETLAARDLPAGSARRGACSAEPPRLPCMTNPACYSSGC